MPDFIIFSHSGTALANVGAVHVGGEKRNSVLTTRVSLMAAYRISCSLASKVKDPVSVDAS